MRVHSTGLGQSEMVASQDKLYVKDGYLVLSLRSSEPVHWHIRILLDRKDVFRLVFSLMKGPLFLWPISLFKKRVPAPVDY
jgi:hypothetical protein